jgi:hypothetical protein
MLYLAYAFMLSQIRQVCGGGRIFMHTPEGHEQGYRRQLIRSFIGGHRKIVGLLAIVVLAGVVVIPYANASSTTSRNQSDQSADNAPKPAIDSPEEKDQMPANSSNNGSNTNQPQVTVNGQSVDVPANGNYHQVTDDANGHTEVKVESSQHSNGGNTSNSNSSTVNIDVDSQSQSSYSSD